MEYNYYNTFKEPKPIALDPKKINKEPVNYNNDFIELKRTYLVLREVLGDELYQDRGYSRVSTSRHSSR